MATSANHMKVATLILGFSPLFSGSSAFAFLGFGDVNWKEEVQLHDGRRIIVKRSQSYGGRREPGQDAPIKEHVLSFQLSASGKVINWVSEFSQDVGRANFDLLALHVLNDTPYIVATPNLCLSYQKWGRPNPPFVSFKYDGTAWQRIALTELPVAFKTTNVVVDVRSEEDIERAALQLGYVPADAIRNLNNSLTQHEYKTILREPLATSRLCPQYPARSPIPIGPRTTSK